MDCQAVIAGLYDTFDVGSAFTGLDTCLILCEIADLSSDELCDGSAC